MIELQLSGGLALVLSNLILIPTSLHALFMGHYSETVSVFVTFAISSLYHSCQANFFCVAPLNAMQICDHFFVYSCMAWILFFLMELQLQHRFIGLLLIQAVMLPALMSSIHKWWIALVLISFVVVFSLFILLVCMKEVPKFDTIELVIATVLLIGGFILHIFAGDPGEAGYAWKHSIWHILSMMAIFFAIEMKDGKNFFDKFIPRSGSGVNSFFTNNNNNTRPRFSFTTPRTNNNIMGQKRRV